MNIVILKGNMTRDPEMRYTPQGTAIAQFGVAVNRKWTTESGEQKEEVTFVDVECWAKAAEVVAQYFRKGKPILVQGRLKLDQWDDKQTGQKRSKLKLVMERFEFCGGDRDGDGGGQRRAAPGEGSQPDADYGTGAQPEPLAGDGPPESDDVPF